MKEKYVLKWDESLAWGIDEIDEQHKDVINAMNNLYDACKKNKLNDFILPLLEKLDYYVSTHFETEEKYAKDYNFEGLNELIEEHEFFKKIYTKIKNYYTRKNDTDNQSSKYKYITMFALHLNKTLIEWLNFHMNTLDKELADFLKGKIQ